MDWKTLMRLHEKDTSGSKHPCYFPGGNPRTLQVFKNSMGDKAIEFIRPALGQAMQVPNNIYVRTANDIEPNIIFFRKLRKLGHRMRRTAGYSLQCPHFQNALRSNLTNHPRENIVHSNCRPVLLGYGCYLPAFFIPRKMSWELQDYFSVFLRVFSLAILRRLQIIA